MENRFKVSVDDERNLELVLLIMESHKGILFGHVYPHQSVVCIIFEVLVPGLCAVKSLKTVETEAVFVLALAVTTSE